MQEALARLRIDAFDVTLTKFGHQGGSLIPGKARPLRHLQAQIARVLLAAGVLPRSGWKSIRTSRWAMVKPKRRLWMNRRNRSHGERWSSSWSTACFA
jgi:hypothetical protein